MTGDQEVVAPSTEDPDGCAPPEVCGDDNGTGSAIISVDATSNIVCYAIGVNDIDPPTMAHIHDGAAGVAGPVILTLSPPVAVDPGNTTVSDCADPDDYAAGTDIDAFLDALIATPEDFYVNVHNASFPAGAVRGQLSTLSEQLIPNSASSYINPDTGLATENPNVDPASSCETPDQSDTQEVSPAGETTNNVHNDACLFDEFGVLADVQASFESSGVGVISACPDPDGDGPKTATPPGGALCTLSGYQETGMAGDFEYHARLNSEEAGTQTVVFCADPEGNGCADATISDTITIEWVETGMVMIMKHYCNADDSNPETTVDVRSEEEFMEVEAGGGGDPIVAVALTVLACPVERLPGDEPVSDTIAHFEEEFDFSVTDELGNEYTLADASFTQLHACEADDGREPLVLGEVDGDADTNVCVDFSFYTIAGVAEGEVSVVETFHEGEHEFGTVRFTPTEVDGNTDEATLIGFDRGSSTIQLDTSLDDDGDPQMVMLHIYNFDTADDAAPAPTPTPTPGQLPDTASAGTDAATRGLAVILAIVAVGSLGALTLARARRSLP